MPTDKARITMNIEPELVEEIDIFRHIYGYKHRGQAIEDLFRFGLKYADEHPEKLPKPITELKKKGARK